MMSRSQQRKASLEEPDNHERWMVSYADFITLLFAFFVVMYAISISQEGNFRVLSESIEEAFEPAKYEEEVEKYDSPSTSEVPIDMGGIEGEELEESTAQETPPAPLSPSMERLQALASQALMDPVVNEVEQTLQALIEQGGVKITSDDLWMQIDFESEVLFDSGFAALHQQIRPTLGSLADVLKQFPHAVQVEGYTDNIPIQNETFPSNWELSAARAASVVHLFTQSGVDPKRMSAVGYGEFRPLGENDTAVGRAKNRRVSIVILADKGAGRLVDLQQRLEERE